MAGDVLTDEEMDAPAIDAPPEPPPEAPDVVGEEEMLEAPAPAVAIEEPPTTVELDTPVDQYMAGAQAENFKKQVGLSDPYAGAVQEDRRRQAEREDIIRKGFKTLKDPGLSPEEQDRKVALFFDQPLAMIQTNREKWLDAFAKASNDPKKWIRENPEAADLVFEHPELADQVVMNTPVTSIMKKIYAAIDWATDLRIESRKHLDDALSDEALGVKKPPLTPEQKARGEAQRLEDEVQVEGRAKRDAGREAAQVDNAEAKRIRESGSALEVLDARGEEGQREIVVQKLWSELVNARTANDARRYRGEREVDVSRIELAIREQEREARGLALGETGMLLDASEAWKTTQSSLYALEKTLKAAPVGAGIGAVAGAVGGLVIGRNPAAVLRGAVSGAARGAKYSGGAGAAKATFDLELGDSYKALLQTKTDAGQFLTEREARGGAYLAAVLKTGIELGELSLVMKALGPGAKLLDGSLESLKKAFATNPGLRALAVRSAAAMAGEPGEEMLQTGADQVVDYIDRSQHDGKLQGGNVFNFTEMAESGVGALLPGLGMGVVTLGISTGSHAIFEARDEAAAKQSEVFAEVAANPSASLMSKQIANILTSKTGENGDLVTHMFIDAGSFTRLYQSTKEAEAAITELMGKDGVRALKAAPFTSGKIVVPLDTYLEKFGKDDIAKKLAPDTAIRADRSTPNEFQKKSEEKAEFAKKLREEHAEKTASSSITVQKLDELEEQLVATGKASPSAARAQVGLFRDAVFTAAERFGQKVDDLFRDVRISVDNGVSELQRQPVGEKFNQTQTVEQFLQARHDSQDIGTPEGLDQRQRDFFIDSTTGAWNARAWKRIEERGVKSVASIAVEGIKYSNDKQGGHQAGDAVYAAAAQALAAHLPGLAKVGGDFAVADISQEDLNAALEKANADPRLQGFRLTGAIGAANGKDSALRVASATHNAAKAEMEKKGERAVRGDKPLGAPAGQLKLAEKPLVGREIADFLKEEHAKLDTKEAFRETFFEASGLLNKDGRDTYLREHPKAFHASLDLNLLKAYNDVLDDAAGDQFIAAFSKAMHEARADQFVGTHVSGDEYTLDGNDPEELARFVAHLRDALENATIKVTTEKGRVGYIPGISFGAGIAETIDAAEAKLNADKERLAVEGKRGRDSAASRLIAEANLARGAAEAGGQGGEGGVAGTADQAVRAGEEVKKLFQSDNQSMGAVSAALEDELLPQVDGPLRAAVAKELSAAREAADDARRAWNQNNVGAYEMFGPALERARDHALRAMSHEIEAREIVRTKKLKMSERGEIESKPIAWAPLLSDIEETQKGVAQRNVLFQTDKDKLGFTEIRREGMDRVFRIGLLPGANKSTFIHESGHVFLELFRELADRPDAPASVRRDYAATLQWMGVKSGGEIKTEHHEKWAEAFEAYVAQGKPPKSSLAGAFERFRLWMGVVYRHLRGLGPPGKEISEVFDRLLATDKEIEATKARMGLAALPRQSLGMTPEQYQEHLDRLLEAQSHATKAADFRTLKDKLRATEEFWKEARAEFKRQAGDEFESLGARKAQLVITGKGADGWLGLNQPLHRAAVEAMVGKEDARKFRLAADGVHPDEVVEGYGYALGYGTGKDLMQAVAMLPEKEEYTEARADQRMVEEHPGVLDQRQKFRELVAQGLHGQATKEWAIAEFKALRAQAPAGTPDMPPADVLRRLAEDLVNSRKAGYLRVESALADERRAAEETQKAAIKGDFGLATAWKQKQVMAMFTYDALRDAADDVEAFQQLGAKLGQRKARERLGLGDPVYLEGSDTLLAAFGLQDPQQTVTRDLDAVLGDVERMMVEDDHDVAFDRARVVDRAQTVQPRFTPKGNPVPGWKDLNIEDLRHVHNALMNIDAAARDRRSVKVGDLRVEKDQAVSELELEGEQLKKRPDEPTPEARTTLQKIGHSFSQFDGGLLQPETLARWLSGAEDTAEFVKSAWYKYIVAPMQKGKTDEQDLARTHLAPLVKAWEAIPDATMKRQMDSINGRELFPNHVDERLPTKRFEILMMLLNSGNESNLMRLTEGRQITEQELRDAAVKVGVTKEEYAWIQGVWDAAEGMKPIAFDLEEDASGVRPEEIVARAFDTPYGKMRGGYMPAVYDKVLTKVGQKQEIDIAGFRDRSFKPSTSHNYLKKRADNFSALISLSPGAVTRHFAQTIHDIAFRQPIKTVGTLLMDDRIGKVLVQRLGEGRAGQLMAWVKDVAVMRGAAASEGLEWYDQLANKVRANVVTSVLGYKVANAAEDATSNIFSAMTASDLHPKHLAASMEEFLKNPVATREMVLAASPELRSRVKQVQRELDQQMRSMTQAGVFRKEVGADGNVERSYDLTALLEKGPLKFVKEHAFAMSEAVEYVTGTTIWLGAYRQALAKDPKDDAGAKTYADAIVRQTMVSHSPVDLSNLMRKRGVVGSLLLFQGAFNKFYNQFRDLGHRAAYADDLKTMGKMAGRAAGLATAIFVVSALSRAQGPDEDESTPAWLFRKMALEGFLHLTPVTGPIGDALASKRPHLDEEGNFAFKGGFRPVRNNTLFGVIESVANSFVRAADPGDVEAGKRVKALLQTVGPLTGQPSGEGVQIGSVMLDWVIDPEKRPRNAFDAVSDLGFGQKKDHPMNIWQVAGDAWAREPRN